MQHGLASVGDEVKALRELLNETTVREQVLRAEVTRLRLSHRVELMACMVLSLILSSALAFHCVQKQQRRECNRRVQKRRQAPSASMPLRWV